MIKIKEIKPIVVQNQASLDLKPAFKLIKPSSSPKHTLSTYGLRFKQLDVNSANLVRNKKQK